MTTGQLDLFATPAPTVGPAPARPYKPETRRGRVAQALDHHLGNVPPGASARWFVNGLGQFVILGASTAGALFLDLAEAERYVTKLDQAEGLPVPSRSCSCKGYVLEVSEVAPGRRYLDRTGRVCFLGDARQIASRAVAEHYAAEAGAVVTSWHDAITRHLEP